MTFRMKLFFSIISLICLQLSVAQICLCGEAHRSGASEASAPVSCCHLSSDAGGENPSQESCPHCDQMSTLVLSSPLKAVNLPDDDGRDVLPQLLESKSMGFGFISLVIAAPQTPPTGFLPPSGEKPCALFGVFLI